MNPHKTGLGFAEADALGLGTFGGLSIDGSAVLIRYTLAGDSNLDGAVDSIDFNSLASHFGQSNQTWLNGDFNYDDMVDSLDFNALAANFGELIPAQGRSLSLVPEPGTLGSGLLLAVPLLKRNQRCVRAARRI
jgi:hypothetical protein